MRWGAGEGGGGNTNHLIQILSLGEGFTNIYRRPQSFSPRKLNHLGETLILIGDDYTDHPKLPETLHEKCFRFSDDRFLLSFAIPYQKRKRNTNTNASPGSSLLSVSALTQKVLQLIIVYPSQSIHSITSAAFPQEV